MPPKLKTETPPIVVHRAKVIDNVSRTRMSLKISDFVKDDPVLDSEAYKWLTWVTRTDYLEGVTLPTEDASGEELFAAFQAYLQMDGELAEAWEAEVAKVNTPAKKPLAPPDYLDDGEKKDTPSSEADSAKQLGSGQETVSESS
jgi:hypothetical protein